MKIEFSSKKRNQLRLDHFRRRWLHQIKFSIGVGMWERIVVVVVVNDITWKTLVRSITFSIFDLFRSILYKCAWYKNAIYI